MAVSKMTTYSLAEAFYVNKTFVIKKPVFFRISVLQYIS